MGHDMEIKDMNKNTFSKKDVSGESGNVKEALPADDLSLWFPKQSDERQLMLAVIDEVRRMQQELAEKREENSALRTQVGQLQEQLQGQLAEKTEEMSALRTQQQKQLAEKTQEMSALRAQVGQLQEQLQGQLAEKTEEISALRAQQQEQLAQGAAAFREMAERSEARLHDAWKTSAEERRELRMLHPPPAESLASGHNAVCRFSWGSRVCVMILCFIAFLLGTAVALYLQKNSLT